MYWGFADETHELRLGQAQRLFTAGLARKALKDINSRRGGLVIALGPETVPLVQVSPHDDAEHFYIGLRYLRGGNLFTAESLVGTVSMDGSRVVNTTANYDDSDLQLAEEFASRLRSILSPTDLEKGR